MEYGPLRRARSANRPDRLAPTQGQVETILRCEYLTSISCGCHLGSRVLRLERRVYVGKHEQTRLRDGGDLVYSDGGKVEIPLGRIGEGTLRNQDVTPLQEGGDPLGRPRVPGVTHHRAAEVEPVGHGL